MVYLAISALIATALFLMYGYSTMLKNILPEWLSMGRSDGSTQRETKSAEQENTETEEGEAEKTPKAEPKQDVIEVPSFTLSTNEASEPSITVDSPPAPQFPALNSAQRASITPTPLLHSQPSAQIADPSLMPPPPPPRTPVIKQIAAGSLRIPSNGPLPNRGPPTNSQQRVSSSLSPSGTVSNSNSRGKVLLSPGHSPMDWAALTRSGSLSGVNTFQRVTPSQLRQMTGRKGKPAWSSWQGKVYNITPYLPFHPGGEPELMKAAGRDGTKLFMEVHPWVNWENMLGTCLVGVMVPEEHTSPLDEQD